MGKLVNMLYRQKERTYPNSDLGKRFNKLKSEKNLNFLNCIFHGSRSQKIEIIKKKQKTKQPRTKQKNNSGFDIVLIYIVMLHLTPVQPEQFIGRQHACLRHKMLLLH